ncbi:wax ester/triacylglycerol synthase family O-acyltransferase [Amycolatopsis ultiminotia]|uniref:Diacylglycerol O-acyltransferase n=1 Tax=Amycolatopsis ultiminotia TaxID=543629 RepID=A0ABP6XTR1_9PSEU
MPDRLSALDASFLYVEDQTTPMHVGGVAIFERPPSGFTYEQLLALIGARLAFLPRYRQRVLGVPGHLARPVWVDDVDFDLNYHVRRSALPEPGSAEQLFDLVARLMSRRLAPERPLWEAYFVEGLSGGRVALVTKTHQSVVDGIGTIDLGQLILDEKPAPPEPFEDSWTPRREPSRTQLMLDAVSETVQRPGELAENVRSAATDAFATVGKVAETLGGVAATVVRPAPSGPLNVRVSGGRMFAVVRTRLEDFRAVRAKHGGTVNDGILAAITGALREWLLSRGESLTPTSSVRALVPMAVHDVETAEYAPPALIGNEVAAYLVDLPVGEPNAVLRLQHIGHAMDEHLDSGRSVAARGLLKVSGFAPATLHSLGARAGGSLSGRIFNLMVTNSPGPQVPMYAGEARLVEMFPVMPLMRTQALAIGVTSYHGGVYFGLNGDRKAAFDVELLGGMIEEALEELKGAHW